jgi:hypothetical protein
MTTFFSPLNCLKEIFFPDKEGRVKSGALSPTLTFNLLSVGFNWPGLYILFLNAPDSANA